MLVHLDQFLFFRYMNQKVAWELSNRANSKTTKNTKIIFKIFSVFKNKNLYNL